MNGKNLTIGLVVLALGIASLIAYGSVSPDVLENEIAKTTVSGLKTFLLIMGLILLGAGGYAVYAGLKG